MDGYRPMSLETTRIIGTRIGREHHRHTHRQRTSESMITYRVGTSPQGQEAKQRVSPFSWFLLLSTDARIDGMWIVKEKVGLYLTNKPNSCHVLGKNQNVANRPGQKFLDRTVSKILSSRPAKSTSLAKNLRTILFNEKRSICP